MLCPNTGKVFSVVSLYGKKCSLLCPSTGKSIQCCATVWKKVFSVVSKYGKKYSALYLSTGKVFNVVSLYGKKCIELYRYPAATGKNVQCHIPLREKVFSVESLTTVEKCLKTNISSNVQPILKYVEETP